MTSALCSCRQVERIPELLAQHCLGKQGSVHRYILLILNLILWDTMCMRMPRSMSMDKAGEMRACAQTSILQGLVHARTIILVTQGQCIARLEGLIPGLFNISVRFVIAFFNQLQLHLVQNSPSSSEEVDHVRAQSDSNDNGANNNAHIQLG
mmetsp:Transcript_11339/g.41492  ORF Transcript_11339/g.41492 Transcript_11339/m.41492 type:complete len:152 (+) Transcript_11339:458-913(+)